jgi:hypothetical protein
MMKKLKCSWSSIIAKCMICCLMGLMVCTQPKSAEAAPIAVAEIIRQGVKKVIIAVDLQIQRLQNESIWLQNAQQTIENTLSKLRLEEIADWTGKQKSLYEDYYQGLWRVKNLISQYQRVKDIAKIQAALLNEYQQTWKILIQSGDFSFEELQRKQSIYSGILQQSLLHLDQLTFLMKNQLTNIGDAGRLDGIHGLGMKIQVNYDELRRYNSHNLLISQYRKRSKNELKTLKSIQQ